MTREFHSEEDVTRAEHEFSELIIRESGLAFYTANKLVLNHIIKVFEDRFNEQSDESGSVVQGDDKETSQGIPDLEAAYMFDVVLEDEIIEEYCNPLKTLRTIIFLKSYTQKVQWKKQEPILGMRFENPKKLKSMLCNYAVKNGYQLWFKKNDRKRFLVLCCKGTVIEHYAKLWYYGVEIRRSNLGSIVSMYVLTMPDGRYVTSELLYDVGSDARDQIYPTTWTVVLMEAVKELLPQAEHRQCERHIVANFSKKFLGAQFVHKFWSACNATTE
ncbi:unnamed protein product [Lactuca saligna]|uniref:Transposase MuDR plant domain-containing protein n=1 Tax=Lactuca saligna TaxID=75948 RepID=A0AA35ZW13_LACSI|nr:unnamed protein product [Lactuca saligna]